MFFFTVIYVIIYNIYVLSYGHGFCTGPIISLSAGQSFLTFLADDAVILKVLVEKIAGM